MDQAGNNSSFPYGEVRQYSVERLFRYFCNNLHLGQWEVARSCVAQLHQDGHLIDKDIRTVFRDITKYPYERSICIHPDCSVQSPQHLSWLSLQEYEKLVTPPSEADKDGDFEILRQNSEFQLLLLEACHEASETVIRDLYQYHKHIVESEASSSSDNKSTCVTISSELHDFLCTTLLENPVLGHSIISALLSKKTQGYTKKNNDILQNIYLQTINNILDKFSSFCTRDETAISRETKLQPVYLLLALYNPDSYQNYVPLRELFTRFLEFSACDGSVLDRQRLLSSLVGKQNTYLAEEFCKLEYELENKCVPSSHHGDSSLDENGRHFIHWIKNSDVKIRLHWLFLLCLKRQQHLLKTIIDTAIGLIKNSLFDDLKVLLEPEELCLLKPLLLLHGWSFCKSCTQAKALLDTLWDDRVQFRHPALEAGCSKLSYQIDLIQWCLDRTKPLLQESDDSQTNHQKRAADMFLGLESHSVLFVLHQSTRIASLDQDEVYHLLQKSPLQEESGHRNKKKVRFASKDEDHSKSDNLPDVHIERWRDMSIYSGFCVVKNVMEAIYFCAEYPDSKLINPVQSGHHRSTGEIPREDKKSKNINRNGDRKTETFQSVYTENVTARLDKAKHCLARLQPLTFRLEMLENLFSLLFVAHEDIQDSTLVESDSDEAADYESSRNNTLDEESIRASLVSEDGLSPLAEEREPMFKDETFELTNNSQVSFYIGSAYDEPFIEKIMKTKRDTQHPDKNTGCENNIDASETKKTLSEKIKKDMKVKVLHKADIEQAQKAMDNGTGSAHSADSASGGAWFGFLINEYLVRDILAMLKDCLLDLSAARFTVLGKHPEKETRNSSHHHGKTDVEDVIDVRLEQPLNRMVQSSVTSTSIKKQIAQLTQYVHEAQWRFQLVCHEHIPQSPGHVLLEPVSVTEDTWEEDPGVGGHIMESQLYHRKRTTSSGSRSSPSFEGEGQSDSVFEGQRRRRKSRTRHSGRWKAPHRYPIGIIPLMLSSPESLLNMCIRKGRYTQASQVTKLMKLEERPEVNEVSFSKCYGEAVRKLHGLNIGGHQSPLTKAGKPGRFNMRDLASVAAAGVATVSISGVAEKLLSQPNLPSVPISRSRVSLPAKFEWTFQQKNCEVMILFDLLCIGCRTWEMCNNMVDSIKCQLKDKLVSSTSTSAGNKNDFVGKDAVEDSKRSKQKDLRDIVLQFEKILQLGTGVDGLSLLPGQREIFTALYKHSIQTFLQTATLPLSPDHCKLYAHLTSQVKNCLEYIETAFVMAERSPTDGSPSKKRKGSTVGGSPQTSPKKPEHAQLEPPVIHTAMKQLIQTMDKELPLGGLCQLFNRDLGNDHRRNRDYLLHLYEHLKRLAFVVAENEVTSKETVVMPKNYFKMLDQGPIYTLGRLMFSKRIPPARLEKVAKDLSLNLTHIIVHSCCPSIPSKHLPVMAAVSTRGTQKVGTKFLKNVPAGDVKKCGPQKQDPEELVRGILTRLQHLMKEMASNCNAKGIFDVASAVMMMKTTDFDDIIKSTQKLMTVDLKLLKTKDEKICFHGNLQNLMSIHMNLDLVKEVEMEEDEMGGETIRKDVKLFSEMTTVEQISHLNLFSYSVGQLGPVSLFELKYIINRNGLRPPLMWDELLQWTLHDTDKDDPWYPYLPPPEPRLLFLTTACTQSSPPLQVLVPELLKNQLETSMHEYLNHTVLVDRGRGTVTIPEMVMWYKQDFSSDQEQELNAQNEGIINIIAGHMTGSTQEALQDLISLDSFHGYSESIDVTGRKELPFQTGVTSYNTDFMVAFDFSVLQDQAQKVKAHRRITSLPKNLSLASDRSRSFSNPKRPSTPSYQLTPVTLDYIKAECPLVATLVSLVCSDDVDLDDIEEHLELDHFNDSNRLRGRTASEMSLMDIRSYRYQKLTDEYPTLKRHLLNYVIPIAGAEDPQILKGRDSLLKLITSNFSEKVKACMLNLHGNWQFQTVLASILNDLVVDRKWSEILLVLDSLPVTQLRDSSFFCALHDFSLKCLVQSSFSSTKVAMATETTTPVTVVTRQKASVVVDHLHRFLCPVTMTRLLLVVYRKLPMDHGIELFQMCQHFDMTEQMMVAVGVKLAELTMFNRITECAKNLQFRQAMKTTDFTEMNERKDYHVSLDKFTDWRNLLCPDIVSPDEILMVLLKAGDYDTAKSWCRHVQFPNEKYLEVVEHQVVCLLEHKPSEPPENNQAFLVLEEVKATSADDCLGLCQKLLEKLTNQRDVLFLASYIITQLEALLSEDRRDQLRIIHMGAKVLLCLPKGIRGEYCHLVSAPQLLVEQLLMNMKIDLAGKAYATIKKDQVKVQNPNLRFTMDQFNQLVANHATKALEFVTVQVIESGKERSQSQFSTTSYSDKQEGTMEHAQSPRKSVVMEIMRANRRSVDLSALQKISSSAPSMSLSPGQSGMPSHRSGIAAIKLFVMPPEPPPRDRWVKDNATDMCMVCRVEKFSMFNRRHHCRRCGRLVCAQCSTKTAVIQGVRARICDDCFHQTHHLAHRKKLLEVPGRGDSPPDLPMSTSAGRAGDGVFIREGSMGNEIVEQFELQWQLKAGDPDHNCIIREDFCYEQAPSTSLCMSILDLHGNTKASGQLGLQLCDDLSKHLKSVAPGLPNPEVDYSLVLSMMKTLLFHAKMKFSKCGKTQGLGQCELYLGRIDLLGVLVADNYRDLPSLQELTKPDIVRRLRDKLIEAERLPLAVEVSTKCGLDPAGVWSAWGMSCLQSGDFPRAREKFSRCLKVPKDRNQSQQESKLLGDIIICLEAMSGVGSSEFQILLTSPSSVKRILACPTASYVDEANVESAQYQECLYYLRTYATFHSIISFHRTKGYWMKAAQYILDHKCSNDVFVDELLSPAIEDGRLGELVDQMVMIDPSLERWNPYLTTACRYMLKHKLHHTLYEFQLFMKDFIRAAMTCITYFYQKGAQSYLDLSGRIQYLYKAHQHMQSYLDPSQWGNISRPIFNANNTSLDWDNRPAESSIRLIQTPEEVSRHLRMIGLQIEVTKFLHECLTNTEADATTVAARYVNTLPTLMGSSKIRSDLVIMILLSGNDIVQAFDLAKKILKEYQLGAGPILTHAAREMAKLGHYDNIRQLLHCMEKSNHGDDDSVDELIGACILVISDNPNEAKEADNLIKLLKKETNKINAYILCGKLRSAYLMAVKSERVDDVQRIAGAAQRMGQTAVKNICNKWLQQRK